MKELHPNILDDYEHQVNKLIELHREESDFPEMESFGVNRELLDDYLFNYQAILDSEGSQRSQQTVYGIIALIPVIVLSAFPIQLLPWKNETLTLLVGIVVGVALSLIIKGIRVVMKRRNLQRHKDSNPDVVAYVDAVINYHNNKQD